MKTLLRIRPLFLLLLAVLSIGLALDACQAQVVYYNDFDQYSSGKRYKNADLDRDWNHPEWEDGVKKKRVKLVSGSRAYGGHGTCLSVKYPKKKYGTKKTGAQWIMELPGTYDEAYLSYSVKFKRGFDFVKGGKLPGLAGGTAPTGNAPANGINGWTARMMWRTEHVGKPGKPKEKTTGVMSYAKFHRSGYDHAGRIEDETMFIDDHGQFTEFTSNRWYDIQQRIRMNTPWQSNGILQIWVDGQLVVDKQDVFFRKNYDLGIDKLYFCTFFGGGYDWRTSKYETAYFDNFVVVAVD